MIDTLNRLPVIAGPAPEDTRNERLRVAIVEREPRLDLHHESMDRGTTGEWLIYGSRSGFGGPVVWGSPALGDLPLNRPITLR